MIGVPQWGDSIIGACVVFSETPYRRLRPEDALLRRLFARHAANVAQVVMRQLSVRTRISDAQMHWRQEVGRFGRQPGFG